MLNRMVNQGALAVCVTIIALCIVVCRASAEESELRYGLTTDDNICYQTESGGKLAVLQNFNGRMNFVGEVKKGMKCILRDATKMPNGAIQVGKITVIPGEGQAEAQVKLFTIENVTAKFITGKTEYVKLGALADIACPIEGRRYAITENNELVLARPIGPFLQVLQPLGGEPVLNDGLTTDDFMNGKFELISAEKLPDGRIRLSGKPSSKRPSQEAKVDPQKAPATPPSQDEAKPKPGTIIPARGSGIWATVIGSYGQAKDSDINVYVLTDKEFAQYNKQELTLQPAGKPPIMIGNLKPGRYYVGIEQRLNTSFAQPKLLRPSLPGGSGAGASGQKNGLFSAYVNDLPIKNTAEIRIVADKDGKPTAAYFQMKWYVAEVSEGYIVPVVCLVLKNGTSLEELEEQYPRQDQFDVRASEKMMQTFWGSLVQFGQELTQAQRSSVLRLLKKGGKVCLPGAQTPAVISVGPAGRPHAHFPAKDAGSPGESEVVALNQPIVRPKTTNTNQSSGLLPPFKTPLTGANEVRIVNPNAFSVKAGLRSGAKGVDLDVPAEGTSSVFLPDCHAEIYFVYSNQPETLYQGDDLNLRAHGVRIQLVEVVGGNYSIRRVTK